MSALLLVALGLLTTSAQAIIIRHDSDDQQYIDLAKSYPMVGTVGGAIGTLVAPKWVLTAAHVVDGLSARGLAVRFGDLEVGVESIVIHPDYARQDAHRDIALLKLSTSVSGILSAHLYTESDEDGLIMTFVGNGQTGTGVTGPGPEDRVMRAALNRVDMIHPGWLVYTFDEPPDGEDLEGISGPGDSGGPAFVERNDSLFVAGVSAFNDGEPICVYGSKEYYTRVSNVLPWLRRVMSGEIIPDASPRAMRYGSDEQGNQTVSREPLTQATIPLSADSQLIRVIGLLVETFAQNDPVAMMQLLTPRLQADNDGLESLVPFMANAIEARGAIVGYHQLDSLGMTIEESPWPMRPIVFHLADGTSGYLGLAVSDDGLIDHLSLFIRNGICANAHPCAEMYPLADIGRD